ncbi:hypothetical protein ACSBR2_027473 [Camellia fascicularis]
MKSMNGEVVLNVPAEKAWVMYRDNEIISKINPQMLAAAKYVNGDGNPGSLKLFKLGSGQSLSLIQIQQPNWSAAVSGYVTESTEKMEKVVTLSFILVEGKEREKCIAEWKAEFEPLTPATPPPDKARDAALGFLKSFEKFQLSY